MKAHASLSSAGQKPAREKGGEEIDTSRAYAYAIEVAFLSVFTL